MVVFTSRVACRVRTACGSSLLATERRNLIARERSSFARPGRSVRAALIGTTALVAASLSAVPARAQSITQNGPGTLIFSGTNGGPATVNGGTLQIDGSITVPNSQGYAVQDSGGTVDGTGTAGSTQISVGTLSPGTAGNPTGSLTVNGNLFLSSVSTYLATFNGAASSTTDVTGKATLSGTFTAAATPGSTYSASDLFTVINAPQFGSTTFTQFKTSGSFGNVVPYLIYNANDVQVGFTAGTAWIGTTATTNGNVWSNAASWAGGAVPAQGGAVAATTVATFGSTSGTPQVTINSAASANTVLLTSSATAPFTFTINSGGSLLLTTLGIDNNSAFAPVINVGDGTTGGTLTFANGATAGNAQIINTSGATTFGPATGGPDTASAGTANITNNLNGVTNFNGHTTAGSATIITNSGGALAFNADATAGNATIITTSGGTTTFSGNSNGGNAVFVTNSGGIVNFSTTGGPTSNGVSTNAVSAAAITDTDGIGGLVALGSNTLTITNGEGSFAGVISGSGSAGLTIDGGTTILTGANSYTGATTINGGTLAVDGSGIITSAVTVNLGGTLAGNGAVSGVTVNAGGTLSAGANGSGALKVNGNLVLNSGADYAASLSSAGTGINSATSVSGTGTINGGTFTAVANGGTYSSSDAYAVLTTAANGRSGAFSGLAISGSFGDLVPFLTYTANSVVVGLTGGTVWSSTAATPDWNTGTNWTGGSVPSATGVASFDTSTQTTVSMTAPTTVGTILFYKSADQFTINVNSTLTLNGIGVVDNSGVAQTFNVAQGGTGSLIFQNAATAGDAVINTETGGTTTFSGTSNGGTATFNRERYRRR